MGKARNKKDKPPQRSEDEAQQDLVEEFGGFIEESLIILLLKERGFEETRKALVDLSENVPKEEASGFDPSGLQGGAADPALDGSEGSSHQTPADAPSLLTSASDYESGSGSQNTPLSGGALEDWRAVANDLPADGSSTVAVLRGAFPTLKESDIARALRESGDDVDKASDILLNLEHLEQTGQRAKGIDAFFQPEEFHARKGKKKNKNKTPLSPKSGRAAPLALDYKLVPLSLDTEDIASDRAQTRSAPPLHFAAADDAAGGAGSLAEREEVARHTRQASSQSFGAASAAARRGRSDPLFRQVAVVYAERGHEQAQAARQAESSASDARVDEQSSAGKVDVHFVPVHDGVRIAVERTRRWWARLGEDRVRKARDGPLQVVTGIGLHSARGYSRMYGEVGAALERDGWKVQPGQGHYYVTGKK